MIANRKTVLNPLHREMGARMTSFAGYEMPISFAGTIAEHKHTRNAVSMFDVSHMGQLRLSGPERIKLAETLSPVALAKLPAQRSKYSVMCNDEGGIIDDMIFANDGQNLFLVCNAARAEAVIDHIGKHIESLDATLEVISDRALLALQGPRAEEVLAPLAPALSELFFMDSLWTDLLGSYVRISRSGYTGEDGFELSVPAAQAEHICRHLFASGEVLPAGLGARNSLRLEAGLCLYGNDLDETVSPVEAGLRWIFPRTRKQVEFVGCERARRELASGAPRTLVGLDVAGTLLLRDGANLPGVGVVTSGGWSPTLDRPLALALVLSRFATEGTSLKAMRRGSEVDCKVARLPFVPHRYRLRKSIRKQAGGS